MLKSLPLPDRRPARSWPGAAAAGPSAPSHAAVTAAAAETARTLQRLQGQLRTMTAAIGAAEARERERIACQLHDELGQHIVLVRLKLGELRGAPAGDVQGLIDQLTQLVADTAKAARAVTFDLGQPAWQGGLFGALEALGSNLARQAGLEVRIDAPPAELRLTESQLGLVCRVVRELCLNVHKHARARHVRIETMADERCLRVSVQDDGEGLARPAPARWKSHRGGGFGLASAQAQLRAFGGELEMTSAPRRGTRASLVLPLACPTDRLAGAA